MLKLMVPEEPKEIKEWMRKNEKHMSSLPIPKRKRDALIIWYGNKLPSYLWSHWKEELKARSFAWQSFLELMKFSEEDVNLWYGGKISWGELVRRIKDLIKKSS